MPSVGTAHEPTSSNTAVRKKSVSGTTIWWLAVVGVLTVAATVIARSFVRDTTRIITAETIREHEQKWLQAVQRARAVSRDEELAASNRGLAEVGA